MSAFPTGIVYLGELVDAPGVADTDTTFWCDASAGCGAGTDLKRVSALQLGNYVTAKLSAVAPLQLAGGGFLLNYDATLHVVGGQLSVVPGAGLTVPITVGNGGTGAQSAVPALANLGGAPLASPAFTGVPLAPTAAPGTNTTQLATTAFVAAALPVASNTTPVMDGAAAIGIGTTWARADHVHASDTSRAPLASPTFTGTVTAPALTLSTTALAITSGGTAAATAAAAFANLGAAPLASPTFTGVPAAPTAPLPATNTTQLATTAFSHGLVFNRIAQRGTPADPTGTALTATYAMMGFAIAVVPQVTGRLLVSFGGIARNNTAGGGCVLYIAYGTGAAPVNGATATGTQVTSAVGLFGSPASVQVPYCCVGLITGLTIGASYWLDLALRSDTAGTASIWDNTYTVVEV
jgi:hypothetical protein